MLTSSWRPPFLGILKIEAEKNLLAVCFANVDLLRPIGLALSTRHASTVFSRVAQITGA
jgi:hypothetical protein